MTRDAQFGRTIRTFRTRNRLTQVALAERLGISASYLNLIENGRRPLTTELLIKLAQCFDLDLRTFADVDGSSLVSDLAELFSDPLFEDHPLTKHDLSEFVAHSPDVARAVIRLHHAYTAARDSAQSLAERVLDDQDVMDDVDRARLSSEQVSDLLQRHTNYFPTLEADAEALWREAGLHRTALYDGLVRYIEREHGVTVRIASVREANGVIRRYDPVRRELVLSEILKGGSRTFQLASQIGLLRGAALLDALLDDPLLTSDDARMVGRAALASYFAEAVMMPYVEFLTAAEEVRYDIELLGQRFDAGFEHACHRLTTLHRPGMEGVTFYFVRVDMAGNISKKLSAAGIRFPRFSGLCALWNVHAAFLQPGVVRVQISRQLDGTTVFAIARTVRRYSGGYHAPTAFYSIGIGCDIASASKLVYADGIDLTNPDVAVPIGITCRLCERTNCQARAFPSLRRPLHIDANVRGMSFFAPGGENSRS